MQFHSGLAEWAENGPFKSPDAKSVEQHGRTRTDASSQRPLNERVFETTFPGLTGALEPRGAAQHLPRACAAAALHLISAAGPAAAAVAALPLQPSHGGVAGSHGGGRSPGAFFSGSRQPPHAAAQRCGRGPPPG